MFLGLSRQNWGNEVNDWKADAQCQEIYIEWKYSTARKFDCFSSTASATE